MKLQSLITFTGIVDGKVLRVKEGDTFEASEDSARALLSGGAVQKVEVVAEAALKSKRIAKPVVIVPAGEIIQEVVEQDAIPNE